MTRFAYGLSPDTAALAALDRAEQRIESVLHHYFQDASEAELPDFRLRYLAGDMTGDMAGKVMELHLTPLPRTGDTLRTISRPC